MLTDCFCPAVFVEGSYTVSSVLLGFGGMEESLRLVVSSIPFGCLEAKTLYINLWDMLTINCSRVNLSYVLSLLLDEQEFDFCSRGSLGIIGF